MPQWFWSLIGVLPLAWLAIKRMLKLADPKVVVCKPRNEASEPFLRWWHVDAENVKREGAWLEPVDAESCLVDIEFVSIRGDFSQKVRGVWSTSSAWPVEYKTLRVGDRASPIPLVVRSSQDYELYDVPIQAGTVYITGLQFLTQRVGTEQLPSGEYRVKVIVRSGTRVWPEGEFYLEIRGAGLEGFVLSQRPSDA
jgi:hypothetical protein